MLSLLYNIYLAFNLSTRISYCQSACVPHAASILFSIESGNS